MTDTVTE